MDLYYLSMLKVAFNKYILVILVFLTAVFFRVTNLNLIAFQYDEATTLSHIVRFYSHPYFIDIGMLSSIRINNFPLFDYVVIIMAFVSRDPMFLSFMIGLINSLLIACFFLYIRNFFNQRVALFSSLLLATSPWAILFSRKLWAQDTLMFFLIPGLFFLCRLIFRRETRFSSFFLTFLLTLLAQIHSQGIFFGITIAALLLILRPRINFRLALLGLILGLVTIIPYINFQLHTNPVCQDCQAFSNYRQTPRLRDPLNFVQPFNLLGRSIFEYEFGEDYPQFLSSFPSTQVIFYIFILEEICLIIFIPLIIKKDFRYLLTAFPIIALPVVYYYSRTTPYIIYYVVLFPFIFLTMALGLDFLSSQKNKFLQILGLLLFVLFLFNNIFSVTFFNQFLSEIKVIKGDYGPIFMVTNEKIESRISQWKTYPFYNDLRIYALSIMYEPNFDENIVLFLSKKSKID